MPVPDLSSILSLLWVLICTLVILALAWLATRYLAGRAELGAIPSERRAMLKVITQMPLGRERQLVLVQAGERYLLLGITPSAINLLAEFSEAEMQDWLAQGGAAEGGQPPNFRQALQKFLNQDEKR